jgi:hypothetical protein
MSGGFRVSDSTIETALAAAQGTREYRAGEAFDVPGDAVELFTRAVLAAAVPSLVAEIREQVAGEIRREAEAETVHYEAFQRAARVARGDAG